MTKAKIMNKKRWNKLWISIIF